MMQQIRRSVASSGSRRWSVLLKPHNASSHSHLADSGLARFSSRGGESAGTGLVQRSPVFFHSASARNSLADAGHMTKDLLGTRGGGQIRLYSWQQLTEHRGKDYACSGSIRRFSSGASKGRAQTESEARKEVSKVEDTFDDAPTYNIPQKPVTFVEGASYSVIILAGLGIAAAAAYGIFSELVFQPKEYKVFNTALKRVQNDDRVRSRIGSPIKGYGQESKNRGARQRIPNRFWTDVDGVQHVEIPKTDRLAYEPVDRIISRLNYLILLQTGGSKTVEFHIRGPHGAGRVSCTMFKDKEEKEWKYMSLIVLIVSPRPERILIESYLPAAPA